MGMIANYQESTNQELENLKGSADFVDAVEELRSLYPGHWRSGEK